MKYFVLFLFVVVLYCIQTTEGFDNFQPAYALSILPSMFNTQQREKFNFPRGTGSANIFPFSSHDNDLTDYFGFGMKMPPPQWDAKKKQFRTVFPSSPPPTMSLKRFYQTTQFPISGTFMPLDLLHARHYSIWNPVFPNPMIPMFSNGLSSLIPRTPIRNLEQESPSTLPRPLKSILEPTQAMF
eukprot:c7904_g1_i1.p1 GENE.c7904_g1_i1~~c7904_g1_i1.p1  ORF type:complete len:184 (+),score=56.31 c7904_g1_i1:62-613(+)